MTSPVLTERFLPEDLTRDAFLGGRVQALQPRRGYRAAMDPVLLAAAIPARAGDRVLELGCGAGVASLCLAARVPGLHICGVERQPAYADLARRNAAENATPLEVWEADLTCLPLPLRAVGFDHVIANPPYYSPGAGTAADDPGREAALREETALATWADVALRRLRPMGWVTFIQAADRLPGLLTALEGRAGAVTVLPISPREGRPARRVLVQARKGARSPFTLMAPLILHDGPQHQEDGESHTAQARAILRNAAALPMGAQAKIR